MSAAAPHSLLTESSEASAPGSPPVPGMGRAGVGEKGGAATGYVRPVLCGVVVGPPWET